VKKERSLIKSILIGLAIALAIIVYAYGFKVTDVNFEETSSEIRLTQLTRIIRALAHPDLITYEQKEVVVETPVYLPCPEGEVNIPEPDTTSPYIKLEPYCGDGGDYIIVRGYNLVPGTKGPINFIPPSGTTLQIGNFETDANGKFEERVKLPKRQPVSEAQTIRVIARSNVGTPSPSNIVIATIDKIIETIFLALLATTFGIFIAVPMSFLAARNLMSDIKSPLTSVTLLVMGWLIGISFALITTRYIAQFSNHYFDTILYQLGGLIICVLAIWLILRWTISKEETSISSVMKAVRTIAMLFAVLLVILTMYLSARILYEGGQFLMGILGPLDFLGLFIAQSGEMLRIATPVLASLAAGAILGGIFSNFGLLIADRYSNRTVKLINIILSMITGAALFALIGALIQWLYLIDNLIETFWIPVAVGAFLGALIAIKNSANDLVPIGIVIYSIMRTILNAIRAIEPLIYVIIFVVWVGIGPFAGALALTLHTIAALAKLFSEQVESISSGPLEAVTATGATRVQTIVYAVVPQIIPPYISFTLYRWDINVRMSTIIGFAGGGGIGFLLIQNIKLLDYRAAAVQILAIAIVVASMDYLSSALRKRFV
jgi:phosphonate ABC transporter permease subunit PhnE